MVEELTKKQIELLKLIYEYVSENGEFPSNSWLARKMHVVPSRVSNIFEELRNKGCLEGKYGGTTLTDEAIEFLNTETITGYRAVVNTYIPLLGEVSAGRGAQYDDLAVYAEELDDFTGLKTVSVPQIDDPTNVVAFRVRGKSMETAGILDEDIIIVELRDATRGFADGQIIVAKYLPENADGYADEDDIDLPDSSLIGLTLKVYKGDFIKNGKKHYRLGRIRDYGKKNPYEIITRALQSIGLVRGVYRAIN